jgi:flagellar biosynthesis protein
MIEQNHIKKAAALKYDQEKDGAPKLTASGKGETAKTIIKIAEQNGIPIKQDEDLVNMLSEIELNQEIPVELYKAVAEVFSFIYGISNNSGMKMDEKNNII